MKAQIASEYLYAVAFAVAIMSVFIIISGSYFSDFSKEKELFLAEDIADSVKKEITIATDVSPGYSRTFTLPSSIDGKEYNITVSDSLLILISENYEIVRRVPSVQGDVQLGNNTIIRNQGGVVYLN